MSFVTVTTKFAGAVQKARDFDLFCGTYSNPRHFPPQFATLSTARRRTKCQKNPASI